MIRPQRHCCQEVVFTLSCGLLYCLGAALLSRTVFIHLFHYYTKIPNFTAYPALTGAYVSHVESKSK